MSDKSLLVHVRFSVKDLNAIDYEVELFNQKNRHRPHTRSSWIREAVGYVLEVQRQRRKVRGPKKLVCAKCNKKISMGEVAYSVALLTGGEEYCCKKCDSNSKKE